MNHAFDSIAFFFCHMVVALALTLGIRSFRQHAMKVVTGISVCCLLAVASLFVLGEFRYASTTFYYSAIIITYLACAVRCENIYICSFFAALVGIFLFVVTAVFISLTAPDQNLMHESTQVETVSITE